MKNIFKKHWSWYWLFSLVLQLLALCPWGTSALGDDEIPPPPAVAPTPEPMPTPAFIGTEKPVYFVNQQAGVTLAGTLVLPPGKGPFPAALYLVGGGPWGRNPSLFATAESMAQRGIAVLIYDKRGIGQSTGDFKSSHTPEFQQDALAGWDFLRKQPQVNPRKVGIIGHSEGAVIAMRGAAENPDIAFVVLLAAPGLKGDQQQTLQSVQKGIYEGADGKVIQVIREMTGKALPMLETEMDEAKAREKLEGILQESYAKLDDQEKAQLRRVLERDNKTIEDQIATPWYRQLLLWDPAEALEKVKCPVLAVNGDKDVAVVYPQNLDAIGKALKKGGNQDYTLKMFPGVNHILLHCKTGAPDEALAYQPRIANEILVFMGDWLVQHME